MDPILPMGIFSVSRACTVFNMSGRDFILVGNNEDWRKQDSYVKFIPAKDHRYARLFFGFGRDCRYRFGGMNEKGLFYDIASLSGRTDIRFDPGKEIVGNEIYEKMLESCGDVDEAIGLIREYNIAGFRRHHIMIVDRAGASAVLEWGRDSLSVVRKNGAYQAMTNFNVTDPKLAGWYPCGRFDAVQKSLSDLQHATVEDFRLILKAVRSDGPGFPTVYSNIYDLKKKWVYVYHFQNFEEAAVFKAPAEWAEKEHSFFLPSLFSNLKLLSPASDERVSGSSVDLVWQGNSDNYRIYWSTDPGFRNTVPIERPGDSSSADSGKIASLFVMPAVAVLLRRRGRMFLWIPAIVAFLQFMTCRPAEGERKCTEYRYRISGLDRNSVYFWKVETCRGGEMVTSSIVRRFRTVD